MEERGISHLLEFFEADNFLLDSVEGSLDPVLFGHVGPSGGGEE
jgi:hypothetical protein